MFFEQSRQFSNQHAHGMTVLLCIGPLCCMATFLMSRIRKHRESTLFRISLTTQLLLFTFLWSISRPKELLIDAYCAVHILRYVVLEERSLFSSSNSTMCTNYMTDFKHTHCTQHRTTYTLFSLLSYTRCMCLVDLTT